VNPKDFVHLHVHDHFSLLDGAMKIPDLVSRVKTLGMPAVAETNHGNLYGSIEFYKECRKQGVKPILGCEVYVTDNPDNTPQEQKVKDNRHMVLLCMNQTGWRNLIWMINQANLYNFYYKPRIWWGHLLTHNEGLIATSACLAGVVARRLDTEKGIRGFLYDKETKTAQDTQGEGKRRVLELKHIFGDRFYLEIQPHDMWEVREFNKWDISTARENDISLVLTTDAHYLTAEDAPTHSFLMAQQLKMTFTDYKSSGVLSYNGKFYIREQEEMFREAVKLGVEQAFWNTIEIAERCNLEIPIRKYQIPFYDITKAEDYDEFLQSSR